MISRRVNHAFSSTEAKYASLETREVIWFRRLLNDVGFPCVDATVLNVGMESAIKLVKNPVNN